MMNEDDQVFVWNRCDQLEKASERETVLRIASELRERFQGAPARPNPYTQKLSDARSIVVPPTPLEARDSPRPQMIVSRDEWIPRTRAEIDAALQNVPEAEKRAWREQFRNDPAARVPRGIENAAAMPAACRHDGFSHTPNVACPIPAPESGVEFEQPDLNGTDDWETEP